METIPEKVEESNIELHTKIEDVSNEEIEKTEQLDNNQVTGTEDTTCESDAVKSALTLIDQEVDHIDKPEKSKHISLNPIMSGVVIVDSQPGIEKSDSGEFIEYKSKRKEKEQKLKEREEQKKKRTKRASIT